MARGRVLRTARRCRQSEGVGRLSSSVRVAGCALVALACFGCAGEREDASPPSKREAERAVREHVRGLYGELRSIECEVGRTSPDATLCRADFEETCGSWDVVRAGDRLLIRAPSRVAVCVHVVNAPAYPPPTAP